MSVDDDYDAGTRREDRGADADGLTRREPPRGAPDRDSGTRREELDGGTRREDRSRAPGRIPNGSIPNGSGFTRGLPPELGARFTVAEELAAGAGAGVVLVADPALYRPAGLKLLRRNVVPDPAAGGRPGHPHH